LAEFSAKGLSGAFKLLSGALGGVTIASKALGAALSGLDIFAIISIVSAIVVAVGKAISQSE